MEVLATPPFKRIRLSEGNGRVEEGNGLSEEGKKEEGGWLSSLVLTPVKFVSSLWKRGEEEEEESRKEDESGDDEREEDLGWRRSKRKRKRGAVDSPKSSFGLRFCFCFCSEKRRNFYTPKQIFGFFSLFLPFEKK